MIASIRDIDAEKMAAAIEADAGQALAGLRESIQQARTAFTARSILRRRWKSSNGKGRAPTRRAR